MNYRSTDDRCEDDKDDDEDGEAEDAENDELIGTYFDGRHARKLYGSGDVMRADRYVHGSDGFVVAEWAHDGSTLNLEISNACCIDGVLHLPSMGSVGTAAITVNTGKARKSGKGKAKGGKTKKNSACSGNGGKKTVHVMAKAKFQRRWK